MLTVCGTAPTAIFVSDKRRNDSMATATATAASVNISIGANDATRHYGKTTFDMTSFVALHPAAITSVVLSFTAPSDSSCTFGEKYAAFVNTDILPGQDSRCVFQLGAWSNGVAYTQENSFDVTSFCPITTTGTSLPLEFFLKHSSVNYATGFTFSNIKLTITYTTSNVAPNPPSSVTIPSTINEGSNTGVSWTAATDPDNNLAGYLVVRMMQDYAGTQSNKQVYQGTATSFTDTWDSDLDDKKCVEYAVQTYDTQGAYSSSYTYGNNGNWSGILRRPVISGSDTNAGEKNGAFSISYQFTSRSLSAGYGGLNVSANIDGTVQMTSQSLSASQMGANINFSVTQSMWNSLDFGSHVINITADTNGMTATRKYTFSKVNHAPSAPSDINISTSGVNNSNGSGMAVTISWSASTDTDGNLTGYRLEKSVNGESTFTQIYSGTALTASDNVEFGTASVCYRVCAYDNEGSSSPYTVSRTVDIINNNASSAPGAILLPRDIRGGITIPVSWKAAGDIDDNMTGYRLQRAVDGGSFAHLYTGTALAYTDTIGSDWSSVQYRVQAYDAYTEGPFTVSELKMVNNNSLPEIACQYADGSSLGEKNSDFSVNYSVSDSDTADTVTVTEKVDGNVIRTYTAENDASQSLSLTGINYMQLRNGSHTLSVKASDGKEHVLYGLSFEKLVTHAEITLKQSIASQEQITLCVLSVSGDIPATADFAVQVTNNANDTSPVWEDCTSSVRSRRNHVFANATAENGFAFNFRVTADRGESNGGYITSIQGGFQ